MTILEMVAQLKAAGYAVIRTERLSSLFAEFDLDRFVLEGRKDFPDVLEYGKKNACAQLGRMIAEELFPVLEFKRTSTSRDYPYLDTYRTEITLVKPRSDG